MKEIIKHKIPIDLFIIIIWSIVALVIVLLPILEHSIIRTIFTIPMILFIPGYLLTASAFPRKDGLNSVERIAISFGLSVVIAPILGLMLNFTVGITLTSIIFLLYTYIVILSLIAIFFRYKLPKENRFSIRFHEIYRYIEENRSKNRVDLILKGILVSTVLLAIGLTYFLITMPKTGEVFTEFYILDNYDKDGYQTELKINSPKIFKIGVANHEFNTVNYTVQVVLDKNVLSSDGLILQHGDSWEKNVTILPYKMGNMKLDLLLFKENKLTKPYRRLHLWLNFTA